MVADTSPKVTGGAIVSDILGMNDSTVKITRVWKTDEYLEYHGVEKTNSLGGAIAHLHSRYVIPQDQEQELFELIEEYERTRLGFQRALDRWRIERGCHGYDLEFELEEETNDLYALTGATEAYEQAAAQLSVFLGHFDVRDGKKKMQRWRSQPTRVYDEVEVH